MKKQIIIWILLGCIIAVHGQETAVLDSAVTNIAQQILFFPHEKIYLHTDKPYYITGEKIFFRAFLLNASSNQPITFSRYIYVELINSTDSVVERIKIRPDENKLFYGAIPLSEELPPDTYKIRAYTQYMTNQGESAFFSKYVQISDPIILSAQTEDSFPVTDEGKVDMDLYFDDFDVSFYPEGGQLIAGQWSNVAFKAMNYDGTSLDIRGEVINSQGETVGEFTSFHDGMGEFLINPLPDEHYHAICRNGDRALRFDLPEVQKNTCALKTTIRNNKLWIVVNRDTAFPNQELYLMIHSGGRVSYADVWDVANEPVVFNTSFFPSGINHLLLLTKDLQVISERLVFLLNNDFGTAEVQTQKTTYRKREQIQAEIRLKDAKQLPLKGNFSIAVTNDKDVIADTTLSILSGILLRSELKGHIENPEYYLRKGNKNAEIAADLLMKTHGWTRYALPNVIRGEFSYPASPFETSQEIAGTVKSGLLSKLSENSQVSLISSDTEFFDVATTDENGRYVFRNFEFPDSTKYVVQALNSKGKGKQMTELYVDETVFPGIQTTWKGFVPEEKNDSAFLNYVEKANRHYTYLNGMRLINLPEVEIKGRAYQSARYPNPNFSMSSEQIKKSSDMRTLMHRVPGVTLLGNELKIKMTQGAYPPLIVIDDVPMSLLYDEKENRELESNIDILNMVSIDNIAQIDVHTRKFTMFFREYDGAIVIHTKGMGRLPVPSYNMKQLMPLGYQSPVEFYSPKYDTQESRDNWQPDLRTTIYWQPDVITDEEGRVELKFYTADDPATYTVIIEGLSEDGKLIHYRGDALIKLE